MAADIGPGWFDTGTATIANGGMVVAFQNYGGLFNVLRVGDFFGTHVGRPTRVAALDEANSQVTLAYPWAGPDQTAAPYEVMFTPYLVAFRRAVQTILGLLQSGNVDALANLAGAEDTVSFFTGPGAMDLAAFTEAARALTNLAGAPAADKLPFLNAADGAALADFTEAARALTNLAGTPEADKLPFLDGAGSAALADLTEFARTVLAAADTAAAYGALGTVPVAQIPDSLPAHKAYRQGNIVGAVAETSPPTGALIQSGMTGNGYYARFADGTQVCARSVDVVDTGFVGITYPAAFLDPAQYFVSGSSSLSSSSTVIDVKVTGKTTTGCSIAAAIGGAFANARVDLIVIGKRF